MAQKETPVEEPVGEETPVEVERKLASASTIEMGGMASSSALGGGLPTFGPGGIQPFGIGEYGGGSFYMPGTGSGLNAAFGITAEKLIVPKEYHQILQMTYDFYQRGGLVSTIINRLAEFTTTDIRNGQRSTTAEQNAYYDAVLHARPSRLMRFLRTMALEYFLSGLALPRIDWVPRRGEEVSPDLKGSKTYYFPVFDLYPPQLIQIVWAGWGNKKFYIKIPAKDVRLIKSGGSRIKEQQQRYTSWSENFPTFIQQVRLGSDSIEITDSDPIMRKEVSISPYPTPFLFAALESLVFKQQLRRMDFAVASRVINAILLVQEGNDHFPVSPDDTRQIDDIKQQVLARSGNPLLLERLFVLFSNHTTKLTWIAPDVTALLDVKKYEEVNIELHEAMGFTSVLVTGESRQERASEVSTYAVMPQMEEFREMSEEWLRDLYWNAAKRNKFANHPAPSYKPIRLQDYVKTAAVFAQAFKEGNLSRTTRVESLGSDFETEVELMKDEQALMKGMPAFAPTPYSPLPPNVGSPGAQLGAAPAGNPGRPLGSQNVPVSNRNSGVKPDGQTPASKISAALKTDEEVIEMLDAVATRLGLYITTESIMTREELGDKNK